MWEKNIDRLLLVCVPTRTEPISQACALTGNWTGGLLLCRTTPNQLSQGPNFFITAIACIVSVLWRQLLWHFLIYTHGARTYYLVCPFSILGRLLPTHPWWSLRFVDCSTRLAITHKEFLCRIGPVWRKLLVSSWPSQKLVPSLRLLIFFENPMLFQLKNWQDQLQVLFWFCFKYLFIYL